MKIDDLIKDAMLSKDKVSLNAYKNLKAELQKVLTAKNAPEYSDGLFIQVASKYAKTLADSINQFNMGGREDLATEYQKELDVIEPLLPKTVSDDIVRAEAVNLANELHAINEDGKLNKKFCGSIIKELRSKFLSNDGKMLSAIVMNLC
jgi:hypothetical protein